ncbi:MAG: hypothetical protein O3B04_07170 [Chloroflexi bacterium]|nr:hypothetical protein [Chloroflexota bacterium]
MTFINVQNTSTHEEIVPARGQLGLVLKPGERATVCPEGVDGQDRFWSMLSAGKITERGRKRSRVLQFIAHHSDGGHNLAA